ncbi:TetR/AcrR family transcriptional regulator [Hoeflea sp. CAU 1731]
MGVETQKSSRRPRADSIRNRERLLEAASEIFSIGGPGASLEAVARKAGVGIGTLYRHFPTREAIFQAVYRREVDEMVELADRLATEADPADALKRWMHASVRMVATKRGMLAALSPAMDGSTDFFADTSKRLMSAISGLLDRGVAAGRLRDDITADELMRAFLGICYIPEKPGWQDTVVRLLDVFVDGLTTDRDSRKSG